MSPLSGRVQSHLHRGIFLIPSYLLLAIACSRSVQADIVTYDETAFLDGTRPGYYRETFSELTQSNYTEPLSFSDGTVGGYSYNVTTDTGGGIYVAPPSSANLGLLSISPVNGSELIFTFTGASVTAFGGNFFPVDTAGLAQPDSVQLTLSDGFTQTITGTTANPQPFVGIFSDAPLTSVTLRYLDSNPYFPSTTNLIVGGATIPEPGTVPLVGSALTLLPILVGYARYRRIRQR